MNNLQGKGKGDSVEGGREREVRVHYSVKRCPPPYPSSPLSVSQDTQFLVSSDVRKKSAQIKKRTRKNQFSSSDIHTVMTRHIPS